MPSDSQSELPVPTAAEISIADDEMLLAICAEELAAALRPYPEFAAWLDDIDCYICPRAELIDAIRKAPSATIRQMLYAIFCFRQTLAMITGRSFY